MRRMHFVFVPLDDLARGERELDAFLSSHRVLAVNEEFVQAEGHVGWAVCVRYEVDAGSSGPSPVGKRQRSIFLGRAMI